MLSNSAAPIAGAKKGFRAMGVWGDLIVFKDKRNSNIVSVLTTVIPWRGGADDAGEKRGEGWGLAQPSGEGKS